MIEVRHGIGSPILRLAYNFMTGIVYDPEGDLTDLRALLTNGNVQTKTLLARQCFLTWQIEATVNLPSTPYEEVAPKSGNLDPNYIGTLDIMDDIIAATDQSVLETVAANIDMVASNLDDYIKFGSVQGE